MLEPSDRLRNAIITGNLSITTRLLVRFPHLWLNVDPANNGWSNLHYASYHGHYLICFHLVSFLNHMGTFEENYSNLDLLSYDEVLVLHVPAFHHHAQTLHYLLQEFPGRIWRDSPGGPYRRTPLQTSCAEGFTEGVKLLLEFGADWRATDKNGDTCMHLAFQYGHFACAEVLLRFVVQESRGHRARDLVNVLEGARNHKGWVPVDYASSFALAKQYKALRKEVLNEDKEFNERVRDKNTRVQNAQDSRQKVKNYRGETADQVRGDAYQVRGDTRNDDIDRRLGHKNLQSRLGLDIPETIESDGRAIFDFNESESVSSRSIGPSPTTAMAPSPLMDQPVTPTDPDPVRRAHSQSLPTSNPPDGFGRKPTSMSTSRKRSNTYNYRPPVLSNTGYLPRNSFGSPQTPGIRTPLLKSVTISPSMRKASEEAIEDDDDERKDRRKELGRFSNRSDGSLRAKEKEKKEALETFGLTYSSDSPVNSSDHLGEAPRIRHMSITTPLEAAITERREEETEIGKVMEGGEKEVVQNESPSKIVKAIAEENNETLKENEETKDNNEVTKDKSNEALKEKSNEALKQNSNESLKAKSIESLKAKSIDSLKAKSIDSLKEKSHESLREKSHESLKAKSFESLKAKSFESLKAKSNESLKAKSDESLKENSKKTSRESLSKTGQSLPSPQKEVPGNQTPQLQQVLQSPRPGVAPVRPVSLQSSESSPEKARKNRLRAHVEVFTPGASRLGTPESDVRRAEEWPYVGQNAVGEDKLTSLRETTATKISPSASQSSSIAPSPNRVIGRGAEEVARLRRSSLSLSVARQVVFNSSRTSLANLESPNRRRPSLLNRSPSEETSPTLRKTQSSGTLPGALWKNASLPSGPYQLGNDSTESLKRTNVNSVSFNRLR